MVANTNAGKRRPTRLATVVIIYLYFILVMTATTYGLLYDTVTVTGEIAMTSTLRVTCRAICFSKKEKRCGSHKHGTDRPTSREVVAYLLRTVRACLLHFRVPFACLSRAYRITFACLLPTS